MEKAVSFRVKEGQSEPWRQWCEELSTSLRAAAVETLVEEKVRQELTLRFEIAGQAYVIGFMEGECLPANLERAINRRHLAMREQCLERMGEVTVLANIRS